LIANPEYLFEEQKYKCNKHVMKYLVFECSIPLLSVDDDYFYFTNNDLLKECLEKMPWHIKFLSNL
jgi:hypothetical protein